MMTREARAASLISWYNFRSIRKFDLFKFRYVVSISEDRDSGQSLVMGTKSLSFSAAFGSFVGGNPDGQRDNSNTDTYAKQKMPSESVSREYDANHARLLARRFDRRMWSRVGPRVLVLPTHKYLFWASLWYDTHFWLSIK